MEKTLKNTSVSIQTGISNKGFEYRYLLLKVKNEKLGISHEEKIFLSDKDALLTLMTMAEN